MKAFLMLLPIGILVTGFLIYRFVGKKELLKMDLVQFIYAFIITPTLIIWIKTVVFYNLNSAGIYDQEDKFFVDTLITVVLLFFFAFMVIHSLTKTFAIKKNKDPLFNVFEHTEYFHMWLSHLATLSTALLTMFIVGNLNIFFPLLSLQANINLYLGIAVGILFGFLFYQVLFVNKVEKQQKFDRVMKLQTYIYTFLIVTAYIIFRPKFDPAYSIYWCTVLFFVSSATFSQNLIRSRKKHPNHTGFDTSLLISCGVPFKKIIKIIKS